MFVRGDIIPISVTIASAASDSGVVAIPEGAKVIRFVYPTMTSGTLTYEVGTHNTPDASLESACDKDGIQISYAAFTGDKSWWDDRLAGIGKLKIKSGAAQAAARTIEVLVLT